MKNQLSQKNHYTCVGALDLRHHRFFTSFITFLLTFTLWLYGRESPISRSRRTNFWWFPFVCISVFSFLQLGCGSVSIRGNESWILAQGGRAKTTPRSEPSNSIDREDLKQYQNRKPLRVLKGLATYYSDSLAGNRTASGEVYNPRALTAANRNLPFGTILRVRRIDKNRSVLVRVNDRGPFRNRDRILDLSRAAAKELGMIREGVINVRVEILKLGNFPK